MLYGGAMLGVMAMGQVGLTVEHAPQRCPVCQMLGRHAMALLEGPTLAALPAWDDVVARMRREAPDTRLGGHVDGTHHALELAYEDLGSRCLALTDAAIRSAESWESALYRGFEVTLHEMAAQPGAGIAHLHATSGDATGRLLMIRDAYLRRLVEQYSSIRNDSPPRLAVEMALGMVQHLLRTPEAYLGEGIDRMLSRVAFSYATLVPAPSS